MGGVSVHLTCRSLKCPPTSLTKVSYPALGKNLPPSYCPNASHQQEGRLPLCRSIFFGLASALSFACVNLSISETVMWLGCEPCLFLNLSETSLWTCLWICIVSEYMFVTLILYCLWTDVCVHISTWTDVCEPCYILNLFLWNLFYKCMLASTTWKTRTLYYLNIRICVTWMQKMGRG
jgi:hypothetical protein